MTTPEQRATLREWANGRLVSGTGDAMRALVLALIDEREAMERVAAEASRSRYCAQCEEWARKHAETERERDAARDGYDECARALKSARAKAAAFERIKVHFERGYHSLDEDAFAALAKGGVDGCATRD